MLLTRERHPRSSGPCLEIETVKVVFFIWSAWICPMMDTGRHERLFGPCASRSSQETPHEGSQGSYSSRQLLHLNSVHVRTYATVTHRHGLHPLSERMSLELNAVCLSCNGPEFSSDTSGLGGCFTHGCPIFITDIDTDLERSRDDSPLFKVCACPTQLVAYFFSSVRTEAARAR